MKRAIKAALGALILLALAVSAWHWIPELRTASQWQSFVAPGPLSSVHRSLQGRCASCHTAVKGVESASCISCHANETRLLQREPTAFHAYVGNCSACHQEHAGESGLRSPMNHATLARVGLHELARAPELSEARLLYSHLLVHHAPGSPARSHERLLQCTACHQSADRHLGLFGRDCAACHDTDRWRIPDYRHPAPSSTDCAQCHRAPPSHSMGHFEMVSKRVARVEETQVSQCYRCHQTTSWNDIVGVGVYDHH